MLPGILRLSYKAINKDYYKHFSVAAMITKNYAIKTISQLNVQSSFEAIVSRITATDAMGNKLYDNTFEYPFGQNELVNTEYHDQFFDKMFEVQNNFPNCCITGKVTDIGCIVSYIVKSQALHPDITFAGSTDESANVGYMPDFLNINF